MILSIHLPKTAGSSFRESLQQHFGSALHLDYRDKPLDCPREQAKARALDHDLQAVDFADTACVHGHFLAGKYAGLAESMPLQLVTWLRHPVQRLCSHYYYWRQAPGDQPITALRRQLLAEDWSLREFALCPRLQNIYSEFLCGVALQSFSFVGISEFYSDDLQQFSQQMLGVELEPRSVNVGSRADGENYEIDAQLCAEIEAFHALDLQLYQDALAMRRHRQTG
jgi:hypothetical protein